MQDLEEYLTITHNVLLEQLCEINDICKINNIKYSLHGGTLLGAIRHNGFIPWDDDADVVMERDDFERFKHILDSNVDNKYRIELDTLWVHRFVNKSNRGEEKKFIDNVSTDIFIYDKVHPNNLIFSIQILMLKILQGMIKEKIILKKHSIVLNIFQVVTNLFGRLFPFKTKINWYTRISQLGNKKDGKNIFISNDQYNYLGKKVTYQAFNATVEHKFNEKSLLIMTGWHELLSKWYGSNFMEMPPVEMQVPCHFLGLYNKSI